MSAAPVVGVMGLHKLTAGDGYTYLTRQVAAHDATEKGHTSLGDYYDEHGESPGLWMGAGLVGLGMRPGEKVTPEQMKALFGQGRHPNAVALEAAAAAPGAEPCAAAAAGGLGRAFSVYDAASAFNTQVARAFSDYNRDRGQAWDAAIPGEVRAGIRTEVGRRMFAEQHGRPPQDARELSGFVARASRQATSAVAGYDLTFSPVKSVSTLWALASREVAATIREAHIAAVADTLGWLEREAAFTRVGRAGVRQVTTRGLIAAAFTHRDSRAGDPDLHTHLAISNKVQAKDGRWLALDGRLVYQANVAASERYNTRLEAELTARLGVSFRETATPAGKRPVREIAGVNTLLSGWWSRRRRAIEVRRSELAAGFQSRHGRSPTAVEAIALAQQATLETRAAKHAPTSEAAQRLAWRREANEVLGGAAEVEEMLDRTLDRARPSRGHQPSEVWCDTTAVAVLAAVETSRATWQVWHLRAEAERQARAGGIGLAHVDAAVDQIVQEAIGASIRLGVSDPVREPPELRRADGVSAYDVHGSARFTSARVLVAEQQLLMTAQAAGGRMLSEVRVGIAVAEAAANGFALNDAQTAMVRDLATSGARLQLALAPAGTGKTTAMRVLSRAWADSEGDVVGLAPSAQAAHELGHAIAGHTDTLAKLTWTLAHAPRDQWPRWVAAVGPRTLVIIDEAGQASTTELQAAVAFVTGRGGVVRLIGDDQQLAAVGAGGVLRDIAHTVGAATLSEVRRFTDHAEAAATLAVREGDPGAIGFYADNGRIHVGDISAVTDQAYDAWAADKQAGLDSILLAPTRELVTRLNTRARTDRLHTSGSAPHGPEVRLADGNHASAGDVIISRRNDRRLLLSASDWVKNGDRWSLTEVHPDRSISARHLERGRTLRLPADYVAEHVQLGYATTVHGAQGMTTDTAHTVMAGDEARQLLYVAISRGRTANHIYLANAHDGDPHRLIRPETLLPPTAVDVLTSMLGRDGSQHSATTTRRELDSPATQLHQAALRYHDALGYAAQHTLGTAKLDQLDAQLEARWPGITHEPAYPTLQAHLALRDLSGEDPLSPLLEAADVHQLDAASDRAAVLDWRLTDRPTQSHPSGRGLDGPLPWLQPIPPALTGTAVWGAYLQARATRVTALAGAVRQEAATWTPVATPAWASGLTSEENRTLRGDLAVWRAAFGVPDTETRPTGSPQSATEAYAHQRALNRRVRAVAALHDPCPGALPPTKTLPECVQTDPRRTQLIRRLAALANAGVSVTDLLAKTLGEPRPLPDEHASDALWWRIVGHLGPAALRASGAPATTLRPTWVPALISRVGHKAAERVMADSAWPALVAAVNARPHEWTAEQLIDAVTHPPGQAGPDVAIEDLCTALVWRVATMTDPPQEPDEAEPPETLELTSASLSSALYEPGTPSPSDVRARIIELNGWAMDHYAEMYPRSWAAAYLRERIGTDLRDNPHFTVGYAPPGPANLLRFLTNRGASEEELLEAGLARRTDTGRIVDAFRDRLIFPLHDHNDHVGFIGRRNPTKDDVEHAGPKYLNTRTTRAFTKSTQLFGLTEAQDLLTAGAAPVVVEGPLDAIAITLATRGHAVGIAPLGTAFTEAQATHLSPYSHGDGARIVIATDADAAGWAAAQKAFWRLAALGANPKYLALPEGEDPANLLHTRGSQALVHLLDTSPDFGSHLLTQMIERADLQDPAARLWCARDVAKVIAALPPDQWIRQLENVTENLDVPPGMLEMEILDAGDAWTDDPHAGARRAIAACTGRGPDRGRLTPVEPAHGPSTSHTAAPSNRSQSGYQTEPMVSRTPPR